MATVLVVEDDPAQYDWIEECLSESHPGVHVVNEPTESGFRRRLAADAPPGAVIVDVMLPWTVPSPNVERTPEGHWPVEQAGLRCVDLMRATPGWRDVPILVYTVLQRDEIGQDLPTEIPYLKKGESQKLIAFIERAVKRI